MKYFKMLILWTLFLTFSYTLSLQLEKSLSIDISNPQQLEYDNNYFYVGSQGKAKIYFIEINTGAISHYKLDNTNFSDFKVHNGNFIYIAGSESNALSQLKPSKKDLTPSAESKRKFITARKFDFDENYYVIYGLNEKLLLFDKYFVLIKELPGYSKNAKEDEYTTPSYLLLRSPNIYSLESDKLKIFNTDLELVKTCNVGGDYLAIEENYAYISQATKIIKLNLEDCNYDEEDIGREIKGLTYAEGNLYVLLDDGIYKINEKTLQQEESKENQTENQTTSQNDQQPSQKPTSTAVKEKPSTEEKPSIDEDTPKENQHITENIPKPLLLIGLVLIMLMIIILAWAIYYIAFKTKKI